MIDLLFVPCSEDASASGPDLSCDAVPTLVRSRPSMSTNLDTSGYMAKEYGMACSSEGFLGDRDSLPGKPGR